jgi:hypothetical protein
LLLLLRLGGMRLPVLNGWLFDRLPRMVLGALHVGKMFANAFLRSDFLGMIFLELGRLGMLCGWRRLYSRAWGRSNGRIIVPCGTLGVLLVLFPE